MENVHNLNINHNFWKKYWEIFDKTNAIYKPFYEYFNHPFTMARIRAGRIDNDLKDKLDKISKATKKMKAAMNYYDNLFSKTLLSYKFFLPSSYNCQSIEKYPLDIIEESKDISHITILMAKAIMDFLFSIEYMAPMRESPGRFFQYSGYRGKYVGITGRFLQDLLVSNSANLYTVNQQLNRLKTDYEIDVNKVSDEKAGIYDLFALRFINKKTGIDAGITDVGFGFSQILPVVLQCGLSEGKTLLIEQPEYHLHPALQAELGDMFIDSALGEQKNTLIIETHSEHLILRILRRIRETAEGRLPKGMRSIKPDQVSVVYVEPHKTGAKIITIPVNEEGEFDRPWPRGFFRERALELL
jgi:predicted ATPase